MDLQKLFNIEGKTALITGGSRGIGEMIAAGFLANGVKVYITARKEAPLIEKAKELSEKFNGDCIAIPCDLSNMEGIQKLATDYLQREDSLDILVNNAGAAWGEPYENFSEKGWDKVMDTNVKSMFFLTRDLTPALAKNASDDEPSRVVNIGSIDGINVPIFETFSYSASKAALIQMTKTTAVIEAKKNIRLNCVVPGLMHTPLVERLATKYADGDYAGFVKRRHDQVPMGKMGESWDVAYAVLFLCSDEAKYITGTEIIVDGGLTAATP